MLCIIISILHLFGVIFQIMKIITYLEELRANHSKSQPPGAHCKIMLCDLASRVRRLFGHPQMSISDDFVAQSLPKRRLWEIISTLLGGPARKVKKCVSITPACVDCMWALPGKAPDRLKNRGKNRVCKKALPKRIFSRFLLISAPTWSPEG